MPLFVKGQTEKSPPCAPQLPMLQLLQHLSDGSIHRNGGLRGACPALIHHRQLMPAVVGDESRRRIGESVYYAHDMYDAALDADALILVTEWKEFRLPTWGVIKKAMKQPVVLDGRNIYDGDELQEMGFVYHCIGR